MLKFIKRNFPIILFIIIFITGFSIMLYPFVSNMVSAKTYDSVIVSYTKTANNTSDSKNVQLLAQAKSYNSSLSTTTVMDAFSYPDREESADYLNTLNINNNGVMGYISIPKIDVRIPIYHGTSSRVLQKGVGHLEGSSLPIGGSGTHSILSAHRGLPSARLFTDLDQMQKGDQFYIYVLDQTLAYEVDQITVIEPDNTDYLTMNNNEDYITLVTCTPYAVNTHRLLVRGHRVEYKEEVLSTTVVSKKSTTADIVFYIGITIAIITFIVAIIIIIFINKKNNKTTSNNNDSNTANLINNNVYGAHDYIHGKTSSRVNVFSPYTVKDNETSNDVEQL